MQFEDWVSNFNTLYYCRIYPQNWSQYCITGGWDGIYSGGAPPKGNNIWNEKNSSSLEKTSSPRKTGNLNLKKGMSVFSPTIGTSMKTSNLISPAVGTALKGSQGDVFNFKMSNMQSLKDSKLGLSNMKSGKIEEVGSPLKSTILNKTSNLNINTNTLKKTQIIKEPEVHTKEYLKRIILNDSEDRWFLNPQFKVEVKYQTKVIFTLLQEDEKLSKKLYQKCNFLIIISKVNICS